MHIILDAILACLMFPSRHQHLVLHGISLSKDNQTSSDILRHGGSQAEVEITVLKVECREPRQVRKKTRINCQIPDRDAEQDPIVFLARKYDRIMVGGTKIG